MCGVSGFHECVDEEPHLQGHVGDPGVFNGVVVAAFGASSSRTAAPTTCIFATKRREWTAVERNLMAVVERKDFGEGGRNPGTCTGFVDSKENLLAEFGEVGSALNE